MSLMLLYRNMIPIVWHRATNRLFGGGVMLSISLFSYISHILYTYFVLYMYLYMVMCY